MATLQAASTLANQIAAAEKEVRFLENIWHGLNDSADDAWDDVQEAREALAELKKRSPIPEPWNNGPVYSQEELELAGQLVLEIS